MQQPSDPLPAEMSGRFDSPLTGQKGEGAAEEPRVLPTALMQRAGPVKRRRAKGSPGGMAKEPPAKPTSQGGGGQARREAIGPGSLTAPRHPERRGAAFLRRSY